MQIHSGDAYVLQRRIERVRELLSEAQQTLELLAEKMREVIEAGRRDAD